MSKKIIGVTVGTPMKPSLFSGGGGFSTGVSQLEMLLFAMGYEQSLQYQEQTGFAMNSEFGTFAKYYNNASFMLTLEVGCGYFVLWDDEYRVCTAYSCSYSGYDLVCIGNGAQIGGQSTSDPFLIAYAPGVDRLYVCASNYDTSHKFGIYEKLQTASGGSGIELDTTLTQAGKAADAKAVNDALQGTFELFNGLLELKQPKGNYVEKVNGQTPDESGNVVVSAPSTEGLATESYVQQYVEAYISEALGGDY